MLKLYHYSQNDFKGYIKPDFFGANTYSQNSNKLSGVKRSYFYIGKGKEYFLNGAKYCYIAEIEPSKIYNLDIDSKNLKEKYTFTEILLYVKKLGYFGISGNNGFNIVCLFKAIKYRDKIALTRV